MKKLLLLVAIGFSMVSQTHAATVFVSQESAPGAGDFTANFLGTIESFNTAGTLAEFYDYRGSEFKNTAAISLTRDQSHLFLVNASDGLGLFVVHDDGLTNGGGDAETKIDLIGGDTATFLVQDDPADANYSDTGIEFTAKQRWLSGFTDGYVIGSLDGIWTIDMQFTEVFSGGSAAIISGMDSWAAISSDGLGGQTEIALALVEDRRVRLSIIPIPPAIWLFGTGLLGLIGLCRRKKDTQ